MKLSRKDLKSGAVRAGPLLIVPIVLFACTQATGGDISATGQSADPLTACAVADGTDAATVRCDGGPASLGDGGGGGLPDSQAPPFDAAVDAPACPGTWPSVQTPTWSINRSFKKEYNCPNGTKAGLNFAFSAGVSGNAALATCSASASVNGSFTFEPSLCGRVSGGASATLAGTLGTCLTPDCSNLIPVCTTPQCTTRAINMDANAFIQASWGVGEIIPQARPFCDNGAVSCTVTVRLDGAGHANYDNASGQGACGCCPNGNERDIISANGKLTGTVTGQIDVTLGWLGHANLTVSGSACIGGWIRKGNSCEGPVDEMGGGWQLSAQASGQACVGSGWLEYCRDFSAGPWTVGPGCDAPGG